MCIKLSEGNTMIEKKIFGEIDGEKVYLYTLENKNGTIVEILNYGGIIRKLVYKGVDVVLGRDTLDEYLNNEGYFNALIGRNSNIYPLSSVRKFVPAYSIYKNQGEVVTKHE